MAESIVSLRDAKARLSELTEQAASGKDIVIAKHGKPSARLTRARRARKPVDIDRLRALVQSMPRQKEGAGRSVRRLRDESRY